MNTRNTGRNIAILACLSTLLLGGCLSDKEGAGAAETNVTPPAGNSPPTISGNPPAAVRVGEAYSFVPQASDPDGDRLTFSIENQPSWASFDTSSGQISGTPTLADIGIFTSIRVSVSDGEATVSTPQFSVDVTQVQLGSVTLSWTAPTANSDGSTLMDLEGYKIYYGNTEGSYPNRIHIENASITTYVVDNLTPSTYFFVSTAVNSAGVESEYSNPAEIAVD